MRPTETSRRAFWLAAWLAGWLTVTAYGQAPIEFKLFDDDLPESLPQAKGNNQSVAPQPGRRVEEPPPRKLPVEQKPHDEKPQPRSESSPVLGHDTFIESYPPTVQHLAPAEEPWRLVPEMFETLTTTGWVNVGMTANADNPLSQYNGPVSFNDRTEAQVNQIYWVLARETQTDGEHWLAWGGRVDFLLGTDYVYTQASGIELRPHNPLENHWNSNRFYGFSLPQFYLDVAMEDISIRCGHFYSIVGCERVTAPDNFFYSHSYAFQYGEPFTHSGLLATWGQENWKVVAGLHNGWNSLDRFSDHGAGIAGVMWSSDDQRQSLAVSCVTGHEPDAIGLTTARKLYSVVYNWQVTDELRYVLHYDNGAQNRAVFRNGQARDAEWYGVNQYLVYRLNDCWSCGMRFEWFRDDDGARVMGVRPNSQAVPAGGNPTLNSSFAGDFTALTVGINWQPHVNVTLRSEVRHDSYSGLLSPTGAARPFDDGLKNEQFTASVDVVVLY